MSRLREIERHLDQLSSQAGALPTHVETIELWPRFRKVKNAVLTVLTSQQPQTSRELNTFSWSGSDSGIHDHRGQVKGAIRGIELALNIEGTTVDNQTQVVIGDNGQWKIAHSKVQRVGIYGTFTSADGRKGAVKLQIGNVETPYEAYWLQFVDGRLRLEQVVHDKDVFDANSLDNEKDQVNIPGTRIDVPRFIEG